MNRSGIKAALFLRSKINKSSFIEVLDKFIAEHKDFKV